jgi:2-polyprenyl-3-methyl-5-hydroxy-6-metoxy-1,4-benzoquinol methylase
MEDNATLIAHSNKQDNSSHYSAIIGPAEYNQIISNEHLYIKASDKFIISTLKEKIKSFEHAEIVELGCGPGRLLQQSAMLTNYCNITAVDNDEDFVNYTKQNITHPNINIILDDIKTYQHPKPVTHFYSQGVHHHIPKEQQNYTYLKNVADQLISGGYYILSDEFIPYYSNEHERSICLVIWYSHIIYHAVRAGYHYLAQEEAKTFLDDLFEGQTVEGYKTENQIQLVLTTCGEINKAAEINIEQAKYLADSLIDEISQLSTKSPSGKTAVDLSRGDYKICDEILRQEIEPLGFSVEAIKRFGPIYDIGGMYVYLLRKD